MITVHDKNQIATDKTKQKMSLAPIVVSYHPQVQNQKEERSKAEQQKLTFGEYDLMKQSVRMPGGSNPQRQTIQSIGSKLP